MLFRSQRGLSAIAEHLVLYYCVCFFMYFIVHAAFVRIKLMMMMMITAFKVILGHQGRYQSKARMRLPISD